MNLFTISGLDCLLLKSTVPTHGRETERDIFILVLRIPLDEQLPDSLGIIDQQNEPVCSLSDSVCVNLSDVKRQSK